MELTIQITIALKIHDNNECGVISRRPDHGDEGESVRAVENYVNVELNRITVWAMNNKTDLTKNRK